MNRFLALKRGAMDMMKWISRYTVMRKKLINAWMETFVKVESMEQREAVADYQLWLAHLRVQNEDMPEDATYTVAALNAFRKTKHYNAFPFQDNLFSTMLIIQSELSEPMKVNLMQHFNLKDINTTDYGWDLMRTTFI